MSYRFQWEQVLSPLWLDALLTGFTYSVILFVFSSLLSLIFGCMLAFGELSKLKIISRSSRVICHVLKNIPAPFWMLAWFMAFPLLFSPDIRDAINGYPHFGLLAGIMGLTFNSTPYVSDVIKSGCATIDRNTIDIARLSGLSRGQIACNIHIPGLIIPIIPALNVRLVHNFKNTSLAMLISVPELTWQSQEIEAITFASLEITTIVTAIYIITCLVISKGMIALETIIFNFLRWPSYRSMGG